MNYEELFSDAKTIEKDMSENMKTQQKLSKSIQKSMEAGDIKSWQRDLALLERAGEEYADILVRMKAVTEGFDTRAYIESGDFSNQLLGWCEQFGIDINGDYPVYEIFPYRVRIDAENQDLYVNRKKSQCLRPRAFAQNIKAAREKLMKASFNAAAFAAELADAYDTALMRQSGGKAYRKDADCYLTGIYPYLAPMGRHRREYDKQSYAFDLARLYISDVDQIKDGRRLQFGPSRNNAKAIRILDGDGAEQFLATVRFYM